MTALYLLRRIDVTLREGVPPHEWLPSERGLADARRLATAPVWRTLAAVATSPEPKARATAEPIAEAAGVPLREEPDLHEVEREAATLDADEHHERVRRYLDGEPIPGWEPRERAKHRFENCMERLLVDADGPLAVVTHGTVVALFLGLSFDEWARIPLPAVTAVHPQSRSLVHPFLSVEEFLSVGRG